MNLYLLVEGRRTEAKVYPAWLQHLLPDHSRVHNAAAVAHSNYYLFSGEGYPSILGHLRNAIAEINEIGKYQFLVLCVDADEVSVREREAEIHDFLRKYNIRLRGCELKIIVQNRAIETWFLGNQKVFSHIPAQEQLSRYVGFYNVREDDPEKMGCYPGFNNHCGFHFQYLREIFKARNLKYSKINPGPVLELHYLEALIGRTETSPHLKSLRTLLDFCQRIRNNP